MTSRQRPFVCKPGSVVTISSHSWQPGSGTPISVRKPMELAEVTNSISHDASTTQESVHYCYFQVESAVPQENKDTIVAFRLRDTNLYLTNIMYGDEQRQELVSVLASVPALLPDTLGSIVDYAIGRPTGEDNFEGAGFNYAPMKLQKAGSNGKPSLLQQFTVEEAGGGGGSHGSNKKNVVVGIKSLFGTYWRSQWWNHTISQSPHLMQDELWVIKESPQ